ncbi:GNAT family N-acetyltransferase [Actinoplanes couchii]|uniref:N-acetyltransferase domain-containing protein n=1 Tax=Actinoplanes couchii TaxID=403638 RepID=A0ABQ3XS05_9ACTN|nr:GNAT family N-acetyltransferase [Actinoplanes couchii]MDR6318770.1 ribosomal protein S18 acetylase RimI-like enzyme [Actinoplanes couchii]GID61299.1 hypothetical protein Aco03nite_097030 [Actinoplanes couchii]
MIRPYRPGDLDAVYDICARTSGADNPTRLIGDLWAAPYAVAEPEHAYVIDDGSGQAVGYIVGTSHTPAFVRWWKATWLPEVESRHSAGATPDEFSLMLLRNPERMLVPELDGYPAHLHMDLLPQWQRKGLGRELMTTFLNGLRAAGVPGVHLGAATDNEGAQAFYLRLGFEHVPTPYPGVRYMCLKL